ncbi:hypothetical protein [Paradesertivirga mongoliensis]|uniref:hypothetical protein n=1 Tax=Paradesertivirga mongoliensis TaxID=2100740 RepID=UPI00210D157F|nr:hypothetical protein [Pedobacter mongoliensis]
MFTSIIQNNGLLKTYLAFIFTRVFVHPLKLRHIRLNKPSSDVWTKRGAGGERLPLIKVKAGFRPIEVVWDIRHKRYNGYQLP